ncbi:MAG: hypothetical protein NC184_00570 [Roseburia sp.]|nr:hypothetical protein [Roseburia sp.]
MSAFRFRIITPEREFYSGEIEYFAAYAPDGKIGFLHGAMPRIVSLSAGRIEFKTSVLGMSAICGDGLIKIDGDGITVVTESCRFENEPAPTESAAKSDKTVFDKAKVRIASSFKKLKDKEPPGY